MVLCIRKDKAINSVIPNAMAVEQTHGGRMIPTQSLYVMVH